MVRLRRGRAAAVVSRLGACALLAGVAVAGAPAVAVAQAGCDDPPALEPITDTPWAEDWFALNRLSPLPRANDVTVAVIDTGVDAGHPQLGERVLPGQDLVPEPAPDGRIDCNGHGTAVASIIAAGAVDGIGFAGLAPGAQILPFRVSEQEVESDEGGDDAEGPPIPPGPVANAIRLATDQDAQIINLSLQFYFDYEEIREAIQGALDSGIIVVAAAGNRKGEDGAPDPPAYPASYEGVVSVGAITVNGSRVTDYYLGPGVDLLAPGAGVTGAALGRGHTNELNGTSFAAPFVSAAAALLLASNDDLTGPEVVERLIATADPGPGSAISYAPVVNPYRALTGRVAEGEPVAVPPPSEPPPDPAAVARAERWERNTQRAVIILVVAISLTVVGFIGASVWRRGEGYGWRPGQRRDPQFPHPIVDEPEREFFTVPTPRQRR